MTARRLWAPLLVFLLVAALLGPASGMVTAAQPRATVTRNVTLAPAAFVVTDDDTSYDNAGDELAVKGPSYDGNFVAPLFVEDGQIRIVSMTLYAYDNGSESVCVGLYRITPADGDGDTEDLMGQACSSGATTGIREFDVPAWTFRNVSGTQGPYLWLALPGLYTEGYGFYGVKIKYTYDPQA